MEDRKFLIREEKFGGIVYFPDKKLTLFVNREMSRRFGIERSTLWEGDEEINSLSAPIEVHFSFTNLCPLNCSHCYTNGGEKKVRELSDEEIYKIIDILSGMKVFQIAFGGGEPFSHPNFLDFVNHALKKGIVPNVTTNGFYIDEDMAKKCRVFGSINVSIDGIGREKYLEYRGSDGWEYGKRAIKLLKKYGCNVGINVVVTRKNLHHLDEIFRFARKEGVKDILLLRFKPKGRGREEYLEKKFMEEDLKGFMNVLRGLNKFGIRIYLDCSFFPLLAYYTLDERILNLFSVSGCDGGNSLVSIDSEGNALPCSFSDDGEEVFKLKEIFVNSKAYNKFRDWDKNPPMPCKICKYLKLCKGGCHVISECELNDFYAPDPTCPIIIDYKRGVNHDALKI